MTVVVVDDSEEIRSMLELALTGEGHRVFAAADAVSAFDLVRRERPQVLLTDIMLGMTNGLDLISRVRSDLAPPLPAIIAMSGFSDLASESLHRGAGAFVPKPFTLADLLAAVDSAATGRAQSADETRHASDSARRFRAEASVAASRALERLAPRFDDLSRRAAWGATWLPGYLGFGFSFTAILRDGRLRVMSVSDGAPVAIDDAIVDRVPLVRDIAETMSSIVLSGNNASVFAGGEHGFFAGVPLRVDGIAVGALCVVDEQPQALNAEDFSVMQILGRRVSSLLSGREESGPPALWAPTGILSDAGFSVIASALLRRCQIGGEAFCLAHLACSRPPREWAEELAHALGREHTGLADLENGRYALVSARRDEAAASEAFASELAEWAETVDGHAGVVTIDHATVGAIDEHQAGRFAEAALGHALARRDERKERIERFTVGRAAPFADEAAYETRNGEGCAP
jgi:CheY-like chemotaxis protein